MKLSTADCDGIQQCGLSKYGSHTHIFMKMFYQGWRVTVQKESDGTIRMESECTKGMESNGTTIRIESNDAPNNYD